MKKINYLFIILSAIFCFALASCQKEICTVRFENENGEFINSVEVYSGDKVSKPDKVAEYEGYTFDNWYLNGVEYSFDSKVKTNITLTAKYNANHYTLSFGGLAAPIDVVYGQPVGQIPNVPNIDGKEYGVWILEGNVLTSTTVYNYTEDKVAVANFSDQVFYVTFALDEEVKQAVNFGTRVVEPRTPEKLGYDFVGWYLNNEKYDFNQPIKGNITLQPRFEARKDTVYGINIFVEVNGDYVDVTSDYASEVSGLFGTSDSVVDITDKANSLIPTNHTLNTEKSTLTGTIAADGSSVLNVYYDILRYTVSFDVEEVENQIVVLGGTANRPDKPVKDGYVFHSWLLGEEEYDFSSKVTSDVTLTAKWLEALDHVVTFDSKIGEDVKSQSLSNNETISLPTQLERVGYDFAGWYLGDEEWLFDTSLTASHAKNINLVAQWVAREYELSFDEAGNNVVLVTYDQPIGELPALKDLSSTKVGNWSIDGVAIDATTVWNFDSNKQANSKYFVDMLSETIDLSTKGESNLSAQLLSVLGLNGQSVNSITENGVEVSANYLSEIEKNATDEASRTKSLVANIGNTEYKLNVFFATKVIYTYEELTKIQEYGDVKTSKFPADYTYTMYGSSGYFILGNDIDASPSMTKTYKVGTMARYDSQTWDTEMEGFRGVFDGRGHTIDKLYTGNSGLLGDVLEGSIIRNLAITNAQIKDNTSGILSFIFSRATAENLYIEFESKATNSGIFGRMNKAGNISNVVIKYKNTTTYTNSGVLSSWQVNTKYIPLPNFENVTFIYENGTNVDKMKAIGNSTFTSAGIKEYIIQSDGSLLAIKSKTNASDGKGFTAYTTGALVGGEFANYDQTYWDLSGAYPVFK